MSRKISESAQTAFIEKAKLIHGGKYDYSQVVYTGAKSKVQIICPIHGLFEQTPSSHLQGCGCRQCGRELYKNTMQARYGVDYSMQRADVVSKANDTKRANFGGLKPPGSGRAKLTLDEFVEKARQVHGDKYDYSNVVYTGSQNKIIITCPRHGNFEQVANKHLQGCGCPNSECIAEKRSSKRVLKPVVSLVAKPVTSSVSDSGSDLYAMLCDYFGIDDVTCISDISFFVKSRSVYVMFLPDVQALQGMASAGSNCVVFLDSELRDAELWLACGAPNGQDYVKSYSWLPERNFSSLHMPDLTGTFANLSKTAKVYQYQTFYAREMALWQENPAYHGVSLQIYLYHNRLKYLNKTPFELSDVEVLRGFTIAGILKGYTVFDAHLMHDVIQKYQIRSVYDPCAGWGERMLYCYVNGVAYYGVDINEALIPGYMQMQQDFDMKSQEFIFADSSKYKPACQCDAVLTCPPYGDIEIYSESGAENLSESDFLSWWSAVIANAMLVNPKYFCFQINQRYRDAMSDLVIQAGFKLVDEFVYANNRSSHFTRNKDGVSKKREYESMLVFEKI